MGQSHGRGLRHCCKLRLDLLRLPLPLVRNLLPRTPHPFNYSPLPASAPFLHCTTLSPSAALLTAATRKTGAALLAGETHPLQRTWALPALLLCGCVRVRGWGGSKRVWQCVRAPASPSVSRLSRPLVHPRCPLPHLPVLKTLRLPLNLSSPRNLPPAHNKLQTPPSPHWPQPSAPRNACPTLIPPTRSLRP